MKNVCAIILAAGKGTRMNSTDKNKVTLPVKGIPIIQRNIQKLRNAGIVDIIVVVGFAKESVIDLLDEKIIVIDQGEQLGTGHAVQVALNKIPLKDKNILVVYGDDAFWLTEENLNNLYKVYTDTNADVAFCTNITDNPTGFGRIIRQGGKVVDIVEEKVATQDQKNISEVNLGGFLFRKDFLEKNIHKISKNTISGEYYLTDIIPLAANKNANIETLTLEYIKLIGINTPEELQKAEELLN